MSEEKGTPPPIKEVEKPEIPKVPEIDPERKQVLDTLTPQEWKYLLEKVRKAKAKAKKTLETPKVPSGFHSLPAMQEIAKATEEAKRVTTMGFTFPHPDEIPREVLEGRGVESAFGKMAMDRAMKILEMIANSPKVQDAIANLLNALARRIEGM